MCDHTYIHNGGFLPEIILLTLRDDIGEQYHVEFLSVHPNNVPTCFDWPGDLAAFRLETTMFY